MPGVVLLSFCRSLSICAGVDFVPRLVNVYYYTVYIKTTSLAFKMWPWEFPSPYQIARPRTMSLIVFARQAGKLNLCRE